METNRARDTAPGDKAAAGRQHPELLSPDGDSSLADFRVCALTLVILGLILPPGLNETALDLVSSSKEWGSGPGQVEGRSPELDHSRPPGERGSGTDPRERPGLRDDPKAPDQDSDAGLVREVRKGSSQAFETLVRRHLPSAHGLAMSMVRDEDEADDLCQEAFVKALERIHQLKDPEKFRTWLLSIVRNRALTLLSLNERRGGPSLEETSLASPADGPEKALERLELDAALKKALENLSTLQRRVFVLHELEGLDHQEIATSLGISRGSSRVHLHHARRALRTRLDRSHLEEA